VCAVEVSVYLQIWRFNKVISVVSLSAGNFSLIDVCCARYRYLLGFLFTISRLISYPVFEKVSQQSLILMIVALLVFFLVLSVRDWLQIAKLPYSSMFQEHKIKEGLRMMGLKDETFYLSWFITYSLQATSTHLWLFVHLYMHACMRSCFFFSNFKCWSRILVVYMDHSSYTCIHYLMHESLLLHHYAARTWSWRHGHYTQTQHKF